MAKWVAIDMTRNMREGFERGLRLVSASGRWIAFIGTLIALIGTVFMTSVSFRPLYFIPELAPSTTRSSMKYGLRPRIMVSCGSRWCV